MIAHDVHIAGFAPRSWHRLVTLVAPGLVSRAPHEHLARESEPGGTLFVLYEGDRVQRAWHSHRGVIAIKGWPGADGVESLAAAHNARFVIAAETTALDEWSERVGGRLQLDDDAWTTTVVALDALRELADDGRVHVWPRLVPARVPMPNPAMLRTAFDLLLPDGKSALLMLFDDQALDTAVLVRRRGAAIDEVLGPEIIAHMTGALGGDHRRDHRHVRAAVEREHGPLAFGMFAETSRVHALLRTDEPAAWAMAMAARDVVFDPMPAWLTLAAGAGVVRAVARGSGALLGRTRMFQSIAPALAIARSAIERVRGTPVTQLLGGLQPLTVLAGVLRRTTPRDSPAHDEPTP